MVAEFTEEEVGPLPKRNVWADYLFRPLIVVILIGCLGIGIIGLGRNLISDWWGGQFLIGMILVAVEAIYSFRLLRHPKSRGISIYRYRWIEWGTLAVVLKVITYISKPWAEIGQELQTMLLEPLTFLSGDYMLMLVLAIIVWMLTWGTIVDFEALYDPYTFSTDQTPVIDRLTVRYFVGGGFLILISGFSLLAYQEGGLSGLASLGDLDRPSIGGLVTNVLVYFALGLVLLFQVRLSALQTRWHIQKVDVAAGLGKQWAKYSIAFLGLVILLIAFLPTKYSVGLFETVALTLNYIVQVAIAIVQFLIGIFLVLLANLFKEDNSSPQAEPQGFGPPPELPAQVSQAASEGNILQSLLFWAIFLMFAGYLIKSYLDDHPDLVQSLKQFKPFRLVAGLLATLIVWLVQLFQNSAKLISKVSFSKPKFVEETKPSKSRRLFPRLGKRSDREQILYYYLNTLQRAQQMGLNRKSHETPFEFEPELLQSLPESEADIDFLTKIFVRARYSTTTFNGDQVDQAKSVWQRIRATLRQQQKRKEDIVER